MRGFIPCGNCGTPTTILQGSRPPTVKVVHRTCPVLPASPPPKPWWRHLLDYLKEMR